MWCEIDRSEIENRLPWHWIGQFHTDGKKIFRWFGGGEHQDLFTITQNRGGIPPVTVKLSEYNREDQRYLYAESDILGPIFLGAWTPCEFPKFNWLKGARFDEVDVDILTEDGAVIDTCRDPFDGGMAILVGNEVIPIGKFSEGAVRIGWFSLFYRDIK